MNTMVGKSESRRATTLDGAGVAAAIKSEAAQEVARLKSRCGLQPCLAVVRVGDDPASAVYVRNKVRTSEELGIRSEHHALPSETTTEELLSLISELNGRDDVDGILVQLPLPRGVEESRVIEAIDPSKDVDGFHPLNVGNLMLRRPGLVPCTPAGIVELLLREGIEIAGARVCVVGRSNIVGRPVAELLLQHDATVTICHSRTRDLASATREADILVVAVGRAGFIRAEHVRAGAVVVDVGMNKVTDEAEVRNLFGENAGRRLKSLHERGYTLVGDVHPSEVAEVAGRLTPVPGGVGLLTVAMLMKNTVTAARRRRGLET
ncbi:MAG TPA: bifunctional 5,10-methylenetetrahydrofolate dehydrogenase/5,10-methenyltetrahydrofolate cyclohydrolase [Pyrinomonadaceae bacterium]|nr:bifunctional 5,10-methylenetetrahydrofolate dehydrogenase/5,10-methenyltetrahydrofolate cyclohydrolase [Pyrinomonadaceae bacterium]